MESLFYRNMRQQILNRVAALNSFFGKIPGMLVSVLKNDATIDVLSRSFQYVSDVRPEILNSDVRQDVVISRGTGFIHLHDLFNSLKGLKYDATS